MARVIIFDCCLAFGGTGGGIRRVQSTRRLRVLCGMILYIYIYIYLFIFYPFVVQAWQLATAFFSPPSLNRYGKEGGFISTEQTEKKVKHCSHNNNLVPQPLIPLLDMVCTDFELLKVFH